MSQRIADIKQSTAFEPPLVSSPQDVQKGAEDESYSQSRHYVKQRMSELRVMTNHAGMKMYSYAADYYDDLIYFVQNNFLYMDEIYAANKFEEGTKVKVDPYR